MKLKLITLGRISAHIVDDSGNQVATVWRGANREWQVFNLEKDKYLTTAETKAEILSAYTAYIAQILKEAGITSVMDFSKI